MLKPTIRPGSHESVLNHYDSLSEMSNPRYEPAVWKKNSLIDKIYFLSIRKCFIFDIVVKIEIVFVKGKNLLYCNDVPAVPNRFVIGGCSLNTQPTNLKAVLLYNEKKLLLLSVAHCSDMKETYENMKFPFKRIKYSKQLVY